MVKNMFMRNGDESEMQSAKIIAFGHHKGGTGKTTSALNVAGWLVKMKKKVLVIDLDPQGNATGGLGHAYPVNTGSVASAEFARLCPLS